MNHQPSSYLADLYGIYYTFNLTTHQYNLALFWVSAFSGNHSNLVFKEVSEGVGAINSGPGMMMEGAVEQERGKRHAGEY